MPKNSKAPFVVRWRDAMLNDDRVKWQGRLAGMALTIYAKVSTGHDCYPSAEQCAEKMGVGVNTIKRGWSQLKAAGWLEIKQLPPGQTRRGGRSALKVMTWPEKLPESEPASTTPAGWAKVCAWCGSSPVVHGTALCDMHYREWRGW